VVARGETAVEGTKAGQGPPDERAARRRGELLLCVLALAWGVGWPINKALLYVLPPLWYIAVRSLVALIALVALALAGRKLVLPRRGDLPVLLSIALLHMVGYGVLVSLGLALIPTGRSVVLAYTTPLWAYPGAWLFLGERLTVRRLLGGALGLFGLAVLFNPLAFDWNDRAALLGNGALLLAAVLWAANIVHIRGHRWLSTPFELVPWEMALATVLLSAIALVVEGPPHIDWTPRLILLMLYSGIPGTALTFWASATASRHLPSATMSLGLLGVPPVSIVVAALALGEMPGWSVLVAVVLILGGIAIGATGQPAAAGSAPRKA
jgi:drug/metabolite transporter (DMT)-like permease